MNIDNSNPKYIHETILKDIVDILSDVKNSDNIDLLKNRFGNNKSFGSIAKASKNLILVFPVMMATDIPLDRAVMVSKAIERKCVSMLQLLFSALSMESAKDGIDYIKKFHTNIKMNSSVEDYMDAMEKFANLNELSSKYVGLVQVIKEDMKNINYACKSSINEARLSDYTIGMSGEIYNNNYVLEADDRSDSLKNTRERYRNTLDHNAMDRAKTTSDFLKNQLLPSDVKKANELVPSMMVVNFVGPTKNGDANLATTVVGVKAKIYPVPSNEIMQRIASKHKDSNGLLKLIQATTREISFLKDFLFAIDKAKSDAMAEGRKGKQSPLWKLLERRATKSRIRTALSMSNDATAITTLVLSQEDVDMLIKEYDVDIMKPSVAREIMSAYNLLGISVIDTSLESVDFIWDTGDDIYEKLSFDSLERETDNRQFKKVVNLMTKIQ